MISRTQINPFRLTLPFILFFLLFDATEQTQLCQSLQSNSGDQSGPIVDIFSYSSSPEKRLLILDRFKTYYELGPSSINLRSNGGIFSRNMLKIDLSSAIRSGRIEQRWPTLGSFESLKSDFSDEVILEGEPYFCLHKKDQTGKCFRVADKPHQANQTIDWREEMLKRSQSAQFNAKFFHQLVACQVRNSLSPTDGSFRVTFVERSQRSMSPDLDCGFRWNQNNGLASDTFHLFVYDDTVVILAGDQSYLFAQSSVQIGGNASVVRVPLHQLFVCNIGFTLEPKWIILIVGIILTAGLLPAYYFGAFSFLTNNSPEDDQPQQPGYRAWRRKKSKRKKNKKKSKKRSPKSPKNSPKTPKPDALPTIDPTVTLSVGEQTTQLMEPNYGSPMVQPLGQAYNPYGVYYSPGYQTADGQYAPVYYQPAYTHSDHQMAPPPAQTMPFEDAELVSLKTNANATKPTPTTSPNY